MAQSLVYITLLAFIPHFIAVWRAPRWQWQRVRWLVVAVAVLARAALLPLPPLLSEDVYRYIWEGKVQRAGFNPYRFTPYAPELTHLRDANWETLPHREVSNVYPPLLLIVFRLVPAAWMFKVVFTGFDLLTLWFLVQLLRARGQNESLALVWAWNPLVILEFAGNAHEMSMAICFFVAGLWFLDVGRVPSRDDSQRPLRAAGLQQAAIAFALATLSHLMALPVALVALMAARVKSVRIWLVFVTVVLLGFLPFADAGRALFLGWANFAGLWRFNDSLFALLVRWFDRHEFRQVLGEVWVLYERPKRIAAVLMAGVFVWTLLRRYRPSRAALTVAGAVLLLSPVVHPWYVTWMVALCCVEFHMAWVAFSGFVIMSYVAKLTELQTGVWIDLTAVRWLEYAPFFALLVWCSAASAKRRIA